MTIKDDILAVMRDGSRIDRFLEITCDDGAARELFLTTEDATRVQFRVPASLDATAGDEEAAADAVIKEATDHLSANA
jgi:hypothetical protein